MAKLPRTTGSRICIAAFSRSANRPVGSESSPGSRPRSGLAFNSLAQNAGITVIERKYDAAIVIAAARVSGSNR